MGIISLNPFSLLPPLEQALLLPAEEALSAFSAILVVMISLVTVPAAWELIPPILVVPSVFPPLFYSSSNACLS